MKDKKVRMNKEDRYKQILNSARLTFIEKGYKGATTSDIAMDADI